MKSRLVVLGTTCLLLCAPFLASASDLPSARADYPPGGDAAGRALLEQSFVGPVKPVAGTVAVVVLDDDGPFVSELDVTATPTGEMVVGRSRSFAVGRDGDNAFLARDGTLLQLGAVVGDDDPVRAVLANYDVHLVAGTQLETGMADGVDLIDHAGVRRERLWVDRRSGVVVRRETFDREGSPRRLVAFTDLTLVAPTLERIGISSTDEVENAGPVSELDAAALSTLAKTGWYVPDELPGSYVLIRAFALDNGGGRSSLHLVYSDGLYSISVYQQPGEIADTAVADAVWVEREGLQVWRWPGAQPERLVWSASGMTFTVVGDATTDQLLASLEPLPRGERDGAAARLRRGVGRIASWLNPFG